MSNANKDILNHKSRTIIRADVERVRKEAEALLTTIEEVWDALEEEGVVNIVPVKSSASSSTTLNPEGL
jgi:hypothetical protein